MGLVVFSSPSRTHQLQKRHTRFGREELRSEDTRDPFQTNISIPLVLNRRMFEKSIKADSAHAANCRFPVNPKHLGFSLGFP